MCAPRQGRVSVTRPEDRVLKAPLLALSSSLSSPVSVTRPEDRVLKELRGDGHAMPAEEGFRDQTRG